MGFAHKGVWVMGYCGPMGYGMHFPAHQVGERSGLWVKRGYGLPEVCVKRGSTVSWMIDSHLFHFNLQGLLDCLNLTFLSAALQLSCGFLELHKLLLDLKFWSEVLDAPAPAPFTTDPPSDAVFQPPDMCLDLNMFLQDLLCWSRFVDVLAPVPFHADLNH